ncbi:MAG: hypothetical protein GF408_04825 [Candidatus Omnitrophica bacterium]|nr:hypothetical protein [Candidatus Omnitrophota bacterium]
MVIPERDKVFYPEEAIGLMGAVRGDIIADVGGSSGYFTFPLARAVGPEGKVYLVEHDLPGDLERFLRGRLVDPGLNPYGNIEIVRNRSDDITLPEESLDMALLCCVGMLLVDGEELADPAYREHFATQRKMVESIHGALKPGGKLVLIELREEERDRKGEMSFEKFFGLVRDEKAVIDNYAKAGFKLERTCDLYSDPRHFESIRSFRKMPVYRHLSPLMRELLAHEMIFFIFEKPGKKEIRS